jgi:hypothetical protein
MMLQRIDRAPVAARMRNGENLISAYCIPTDQVFTVIMAAFDAR